MTNMLLDEPIERVEQDALGRADFAQSVADLILTAPQGSSSQVIGLYGKWGEGKTSLKNMVAECLIDLDGAARPYDAGSTPSAAGYDMGAFEYHLERVYLPLTVRE